jgi:signal transduction histidine kinase
MTPRSLSDSLSSPDPTVVRAAVRACAAYLRSDDLSEDRRALAEILLGAVAHPDPEVRQAIADVCDLFPDPFFTRALEALIHDADHYVRTSARRAGDRRARRDKSRAKDDARDERYGELLAEIESTYDAGARRLAERAVRRGVEHLAARLDHELTKPRAAVDRALALLTAAIDRPDRNPVEMRRLAGEVAEGVALLQSIVERTRAYAQPFKPTFRPERLVPLLEEARDQLLARSRALAARIDVTLVGDAALTAHVDRHALLQALQNALQNAVEAYDPEKQDPSARISVALRAEPLQCGTQVAITVTDRGRGMSDEQRAKLFVPFGSTKTGGTGLGLLVARKMIDDVHGGTFAIDSVLGEGTTVTMTLPATQPGVR